MNAISTATGIVIIGMIALRARHRKSRMKRRKKHHQNSRPPAEKPTSLTLIGFSIFTFMPKEKAALVIIKTRLLDHALGE